MVSKITDKILPQVKEWQSRPLNPVYPFVFMDCIHYKVREDGRILSRAAYVVLGVTVEGYKDILSITAGANETSKFWLGMLNDLKNRGVKDVLFFCVDGLPGFKEAIQAVYPQAEIQRCVIHMLRNSFKYVNYNDLKKFSSDFKEVYNAPNETAALTELENMKEKWGKKYPYAISNWENNWEDVSSFFQFSNDIRRIMYDKYHRRIEPPVSESHENVKAYSQAILHWKKMLHLASENVVKSGRRDTETGSGIESADSPLRRTAYCLSVREKKSRNGEALLSPSFLLSVYSFGIYIIARNFRSYSRGRVWAEPTKGANNHDALLIMQKLKMMYIIFLHGNTVSTKIYLTAA